MSESTRISYHDVKAKVLESIKDNTWAPGTIMPGEIELAQIFGCARATVNRALRELAEEGIVERKRKAGTLVKLSPTPRAKLEIPLIREEIEKTGGTYRYALVTRTHDAAPNWLRARLALPRTCDVLHLRCMHYRDNKPYQFEDRWINLDLVPNATNINFEKTSPNEWLLREISFTKAEITFSATAANTDISQFLDCHAGDPLFTNERMTWLNETAVTFARLVFAPGYQMTTHF